MTIFPEDRGGSERLAAILRWIGWGTTTAFLAAIAPARWLIDIANWMNLSLKDEPLPIYLARHLSLLYGLVGILFLWIASDVDRYRPLVPRLAIAAIIFGVAQAIIDVCSSMPWWYTTAESVSTIVGGGMLWILNRRL